PPGNRSPGGDERARPPARALPALLLARRARLPPRLLPGGGTRKSPRDRDQRAREGDDRRAASRRAGAGPRHPPRDRPRAAAPRRSWARAVPALSGQRLAAQEPHAAARSLRARPARAARAATRADRLGAGTAPCRSRR